MAPIYGFHAALAEGATGAALCAGLTMSRTVWRRATGDGRAGRVLVGRVTIPAAVAALNRLRIGPFSPTLTGDELRRAGLARDEPRGRRARARRRARPVRPHPPPRPAAGDDPAEWSTLAGKRLWNTRQLVPRVDLHPRRPRSAAPTGPARSPGSSRAGRRGSRTPCAATRRGTGCGGRRAGRVGDLVELARAPPERPGEGRPDRRVAPARVDVVARAAAADPDRALGHAVDVVVVGGLRVRPDLESSRRRGRAARRARRRRS